MMHLKNSNNLYSQTAAMICPIDNSSFKSSPIPVIYVPRVFEQNFEYIWAFCYCDCLTNAAHSHRLLLHFITRCYSLWYFSLCNHFSLPPKNFDYFFDMFISYVCSLCFFFLMHVCYFQRISFYFMDWM